MTGKCFFLFIKCNRITCQYFAIPEVVTMPQDRRQIKHKAVSSMAWLPTSRGWENTCWLRTGAPSSPAANATNQLQDTLRALGRSTLPVQCSSKCGLGTVVYTRQFQKLRITGQKLLELFDRVFCTSTFSSHFSSYLFRALQHREALLKLKRPVPSAWLPTGVGAVSETVLRGSLGKDSRMQS